MKLDPIFTVKENKLYKISDNSAVDTASLKKIKIKWSQVELAEESYNEEYLASLREELKTMDDAGTFALLGPIVDKPLENADQLELFINAFNHTARRVKDCVSVVGFILPEEITAKGFGESSPAADFMETLAIKHSQYVYFSKNPNAPKNIVII